MHFLKTSHPWFYAHPYHDSVSPLEFHSIIVAHLPCGVKTWMIAWKQVMRRPCHFVFTVVRGRADFAPVRSNGRILMQVGRRILLLSFTEGRVNFLIFFHHED